MVEIESLDSNMRIADNNSTGLAGTNSKVKQNPTVLTSTILDLSNLAPDIKASMFYAKTACHH